MHYEAEIVHPAIERWLAAHHYYYVHECPIEDGRPDYIAWYERDHIPYGRFLIVEAKVCPDRNHLLAALNQLIRYVNCFPYPCRAAYAFPVCYINREIRQWCVDTNAYVIGVDVPITKRQWDELPLPTLGRYLNDNKPTAYERYTLPDELAINLAYEQE